MKESTLNSRDRKFTMRLSVLDGVLIAFFIQILNGPLFTKFWLQIGASQTTIGLITGMLWGMQIFSPLASIMLPFFKTRARLAAITGLIGRTCFLVAVIVAMLGKAADGVPLMVLLVAIGSFFLAINNAAWPVLMAEVVPCETCARYMAWRNAVITGVGTALSIVASIFLDNSGHSIFNIGMALVIGISLSLLGAFSLFFHKEPQIPIEPVNLGQAYGKPFSNINFKRFIAYVFATYFVMTMMFPLQNTYFFKFLLMNFVSVSFYYSIISVVMFILGTTISYLIDKAGSKPMLYLSTSVLGIIMPLLLFLATPKTTWPIYLVALCEPLILGVVAPSIYRLSVHTAPMNNRLTYMIMFVAAMGLGGGLGAALSGPLYNLVKSFEFVAFGIDFNAYRLSFLLIGCFRLFTNKLLQFLSEENAWSVKQTVKYILVSVFRRRKSDLNE